MMESDVSLLALAIQRLGFACLAFSIAWWIFH